MAFKFKARAGFDNCLEGDYGCGIPNRDLGLYDLDYIAKEYCKETADICELIFKGMKPSQIKCNCECKETNGWIVNESLQGGELFYEEADKDFVEYANIALECYCTECGSDVAQIDWICVRNDSFNDSGFTI